ncbi:HAD-IIB family hydrolase [Lysinibacillus sp. NPDC047702]|uniref:HAD-IIB family hydrolase n=1 Tax=unclassified Lysinibacillus TaxID=2636778 RepID=UPI003CFBD4C6
MKFVFDIDGTICFDGKTIDETICEVFDELLKAKHEIVFASARPIRDLLPVLPEQFRLMSMVGGNGAFTFERGKIQVEYFKSDILQHLITTIHSNQLSYLADSDWDYAFTGDPEHPVYINIDKTRAKNLDIAELQQICKLILFHPTQEVLQEVLKLPVSVVTYKNEHAIDISPFGVNKVKGLHKLKIDQFIAFGNDSNDQCLFEHAIHSVCVGNHEVQRFATETIDRAYIPATIRKIIKNLEECNDENTNEIKTR